MYVNYLAKQIYYAKSVQKMSKVFKNVSLTKLFYSKLLGLL